MYKLFMKEVRLSAHPLSFIFIIFSLLFLVPGYPVLCAPFFVTLGLFQSFQKARENSDVLFSVLLPVPKSDTVRGKFIFVIFIELCSLLVMTGCVILRGTLLRDSMVYLSNPMMRADLTALSLSLLVFALFNSIFLSLFFRTAYSIGIPFLLYSLTAFTVIGSGEVLSHLPLMGLFDDIWGTGQFIVLAAGVLLYSLLTLLSYRMSVKSFEMLDL